MKMLKDCGKCASPEWCVGPNACSEAVYEVVRHCGNCEHMLRNVCNGCGAPEFDKWEAAEKK